MKKITIEQMDAMCDILELDNDAIFAYIDNNNLVIEPNLVKFKHFVRACKYVSKLDNFYKEQETTLEPIDMLEYSSAQYIDLVKEYRNNLDLLLNIDSLPSFKRKKMYKLIELSK